MTPAQVRLGVVTPMANEAASAERFVREVIGVCTHLGFAGVRFFAVLDRVSTDGTLDLLRALEPQLPALRVVWAPENRGVVDAYLRGYREALARNCDWILEIDAGYSHAPAEIPRLVARMTDGVDCVFGSRFARGGRYDGRLSMRYVVSRGGSWLASLLLGTRLSDMTSGFQLMRRETLQAILARGVTSRGPFFQTEMKYYAHRFAIAEVPISYRPTNQRVRGSSMGDALRTLWRLFLGRLRGADGQAA